MATARAKHSQNKKPTDLPEKMKNPSEKETEALSNEEFIRKTVNAEYDAMMKDRLAKEPVSEKEGTDDQAEDAAPVKTGEKPEDKAENSVVSIEFSDEPNQAKKPIRMPKTKKIVQAKELQGQSGGRGNVFVFAIVLMLIAGIVGGMLGFVNHLTADKIAQFEAQQLAETLQKVWPDATEFKKASEVYRDFKCEDDAVSEIYLAYKGQDLLGYCVDALAYGYSNTPIKLIVGINNMGFTVNKICVQSHSETPGIGEKVISSNEAFFSQFEGHTQPIAFSGDITAVSGATYTSTGILNGVNTALSAVVLLYQTQDGGEAIG